MQSINAINSFLRYSQTRVATTIFDHAHKKYSVNFHESVEHAKNWNILSICSRDVVVLKILQSDWLRAIGTYLENWIFLIYGICAGTQETTITFVANKVRKRY